MHTKRSGRSRGSRVVATVCLATVMVSLPAGAAAATTSCRARNVTKDRPSRSDLQVVMDAADAGDTIAVRGVCVGTFAIHESLTIVGHATTDAPVPTLNGDGAGQVVHIRASSTVTLTNLTITGGHTYGAGGGIYNQGTLTLVDAMVRGNRTHWAQGGAVYNGGTLVLNGSSSVLRNRGGGIYNDGTVTMNDRSSVRLHLNNVGIDNHGTVTMNGSSSVRRNRYAGVETWASFTMNDSSSVSGNRGSQGGIAVDHGDLVMNGSSSVHGNRQVGIAVYFGTSATMNDSSSVRGNRGGYGGGVFLGGTLTMNDASRVTGNVAARTGGGIYDTSGDLILNGTSSVTGNTSARGGGGVTVDGGSMTLSDASHVTGNTALVNGGGIAVRSFGALTMNGTSSVTGNRMDYDDDGVGTGGGVYCRRGTITGVVKAGNVNDNYRGPTGTRENNVVIVDC